MTQSGSNGENDNVSSNASMSAKRAAPVASGPRRSSVRISLVLIGAASMQGCGDPQPQVVQRDLYENRGKCVQDWGDEKKCELVTDGQNRGYWYGPGYSWGHATGYSGRSSGAPEGNAAALSGAVPKGKNAIGTTQVTRSGFGSSARAHSSGS